MCCSSKCVKVVLILLNVLFWIFGLGLLGVGVWIKVDKDLANIGQTLNIGFSENTVEIVAWIFIGAGIFAFVVGFFGCCGAIRESRVLLGFYIFCLVIIFAAEIAIVVLVALRYKDYEDKIKSEGESWLKDQYNGDSLISKGFNYVQVKFCCCGFNDYRDYKDSKYVNETGAVQGAYLALACCKPSESTVGETTINVEDQQECIAEAKKLGATTGTPPDFKNEDEQCAATFRPGGCVKSVIDWANDYMIAFIAVGAGVAFIEIFVFAMAVIMCIRIARDSDK